MKRNRTSRRTRAKVRVLRAIEDLMASAPSEEGRVAWRQVDRFLMKAFAVEADLYRKNVALCGTIAAGGHNDGNAIAARNTGRAA